MKLLIKILATAVLVTLIAHLMSGVHIAGFMTAVIVAVVLGLLNIFFKPLMILLTLPFTIVTFGLFLLIINAVIILVCTKIVGGFSVDSFWTALLFSVVLSISQSIMYRIIGDGK